MDERETKDRLLLAVLPDVPFDGWSAGGLRHAARALALGEAQAIDLFPRGGTDLVAWFSDWADREMLAGIGGPDFAGMPVRQKVAAAIAARLAILTPYREAVRRAASFLVLPHHAPLGMRLLYNTVDAIWYAAGDTATDFNFYSKRALLAAVYGATLLYWLDDASPENADTDAFLARRLAGVMALPRFGGRLAAIADRLPSPLRFLRAAQRR